jgi:SAM-dependent methyltransferase
MHVTVTTGENLMSVPAPPAPVADWQLPDGVDRNLWQHVHDANLARTYDQSLRDCPLLEVDAGFVHEHCSRPGRLIDLGCGTGRVLIPMAEHGHEVLGVDLSQEMLRITAEKAQAAAATVFLLRANLVQLDGLAEGSFDYALCLFSTLGMIRGHGQRQRVLAHAHRLLRPGGKLMLHVHNRWFNCWNPQGRKWLVADGFRSLRRSATAGDRDMPAHDRQGRLTLHLFTRREILRLLRRVGFRIAEVRPVSLAAEAHLRWPWWFGWLRTYGYLIAARK